MTNNKEEVKVWLVGCGGTEVDGVNMWRVKGTKSQVKKHLIKLIKEDKKEDNLRYDYGTEKMSEIEERPNGSLYGYAVYSDYHIDYEATPEEAPEILA